MRPPPLLTPLPLWRASLLEYGRCGQEAPENGHCEVAVHDAGLDPEDGRQPPDHHRPGRVVDEQRRDQRTEERKHCRAFLTKGLQKANPTSEEFCAYGQACIEMARGIYQLLRDHKAVLFASMIPKRKSSEFFAFFGVFERYAGIFGPLIFGWVTAYWGNSRNAIRKTKPAFSATVNATTGYSACKPSVRVHAPASAISR